eukprot:Tamp_00581.p1 GENE.Tamp_00581~~Tamp_00581.p1  ORF type:complete len:557 (+),score=33.05 Tamp_00581:2505-4175(+)
MPLGVILRGVADMFAALWTGCRSMFRGVPSLGVASLGVINRPSAGAPAPLLEPSPATAHATPPAAAVVAPPLPALCGPEMLSARHCLISSRTLLGRSPLLGSRDTTAHGPGTSLRRSHVSIQKGAGRLGPLPPHLANCQERAVRNSPDGGRASSWAVWALISASLTAPSRCAIDHSAQDGPAHQARPGTHACGRAGAGWCSRSGGPGTHAWPRGQTCSRWRCRPVRPCHARGPGRRACRPGLRRQARRLRAGCPWRSGLACRLGASERLGVANGTALTPFYYTTRLVARSNAIPDSRGRVWAGSAAGVAAGRLPRRAAMVDVIDYYDEAEEYLEHISDDIPLFTNTRDGVFSEGARTAPAPLESNSDLFVSPMRAQLASRRAQKASMPASGGVASAAARFEGRGGGPLAPRASGINGGKPLGSARVQEAAVQEQPIEIPDLQDGIADLQMGDSDEEKDEEEVDTADDFGDIPVAPSRSTETSPQLQPKSHGSPPSDKSPGLPDKMMSELAFANAEGRDVSPHVIQGLVQIMRDGAHEKRKKATIAMCNLCCESQQV